MDSLKRIFIEERLLRNEEIPVTILPEVLEYIHVFEDGSDTSILAKKSIGKNAFLKLNWTDPIKLYDLRVINAPKTFNELIPTYTNGKLVLIKESFILENIITITSLNCLKLGHEKETN